ncbi:MAG: hypothetical protein LUC92_00130 [Clostridiales bacterium]|nr:hypothetical protein [Clostridiales bacterium]
MAAEVFCKAKGSDPSDYITQNNIEIDYNRFDDTKNVYALLACRLGIMSKTDDNTFSPARGISYDEAAAMLNNTSKRLGLSLNFTLADFEGDERPALSREQAYKNLCRIYEAAVSK